MYQDINSTLVNTDSELVKALRLKNQQRIEREIGEVLKEASLIDRLVYVRENLLEGLDNVKGDNLITPRQRFVGVENSAGNGDFYYPSPEHIGEYSFPNLVQRIDSLYDFILDNLDNYDKEQLRQIAFRLASVVYVLGVIVHPYIDVNGQTFRLTALSYINELLNAKHGFIEGVEKEKTFIPLDKIYPEDKNAHQEFKIKIDKAFNSLEPDLQNIIQLRKKDKPTRNLDPAYQAESSVISNRAFEIPIEQIQIDSEDFLKQIIGDKYPKYKDLVTYILSTRLSLPDLSFKNLEDLYSYLESPIKGFDDIIEAERIRIQENTQVQQLQQLEQMLNSILISSLGYEFLLDFIFKGQLTEIYQQDYQLLFNFFTQITIQFEQVVN